MTEHDDIYQRFMEAHPGTNPTSLRVAIAELARLGLEPYVPPDVYVVPANAKRTLSLRGRVQLLKRLGWSRKRINKVRKRLRATARRRLSLHTP